VSLLAMMSCRPTNIFQLYSTPVGAWLASDGGLTADHLSVECIQSNCGSEPAREGGITADHFL
jgi:hypothetical protein